MSFSTYKSFSSSSRAKTVFSLRLVSQVSTRLITFVLNLITARLLTVDDYGVGASSSHLHCPVNLKCCHKHASWKFAGCAWMQLSAVQFHLINTTILFLSREGFRRGCLRAQQAEAGSTKSILGTAALSIPFGLAVTLAVCAVSLRSALSLSSPYAAAVALQGCSPRLIASLDL